MQTRTWFPAAVFPESPRAHALANAPARSFADGTVFASAPLRERNRTFLIKDFALLGISLWALGDAWTASERKSV
jgi:hypothetical protein